MMPLDKIYNKDPSLKAEKISVLSFTSRSVRVQITHTANGNGFTALDIKKFLKEASKQIRRLDIRGVDLQTSDCSPRKLRHRQACG